MLLRSTPGGKTPQIPYFLNIDGLLWNLIYMLLGTLQSKIILLFSRTSSLLPPWGRESKKNFRWKYWPIMLKFGMYTLYYIANETPVSFFEFHPPPSPSRWAPHPDFPPSRLPQVRIIITLYVRSVAVKKRIFHVSFLHFSKSTILPFLKYLCIAVSFGM